MSFFCLRLGCQVFEIVEFVCHSNNKMTVSKPYFCLSLLTLAVTSGLAHGADTRDPLLNVAEVVVVRGEQPTAEAMATTHWRIDADDIRQSGVASLDQLLATVPGIHVRTGGEGTPRIDIRGLKTRHVTFLINGVPASSAADGQFDPSVIPTSQIAAVDVSVGPSSVLYGVGGAAGVINVITRSGADAGVSGRMELAENDTFNADMALGGSGERWQGFVSASRQSRDSWPLSDDYAGAPNQPKGDRLNADKEIDSFYGQGNYWLSDRTQIGANLTLRQGEWGKPGRDGSGSGKAKFERVDDFKNTSAQLSLAHQFDDVFTLRGYGYFNRTETLESVYSDGKYDTLTQRQAGRIQGTGAEPATDQRTWQPQPADLRRQRRRAALG